MGLSAEQEKSQISCKPSSARANFWQARAHSMRPVELPLWNTQVLARTELPPAGSFLVGDGLPDLVPRGTDVRLDRRAGREKF
jgi:hypothetical protein